MGERRPHLEGPDVHEPRAGVLDAPGAAGPLALRDREKNRPSRHGGRRRCLLHIPCTAAAVAPPAGEDADHVADQQVAGARGVALPGPRDAAGGGGAREAERAARRHQRPAASAAKQARVSGAQLGSADAGAGPAAWRASHAWWARSRAATSSSRRCSVLLAASCTWARRSSASGHQLLCSSASPSGSSSSSSSGCSSGCSSSSASCSSASGTLAQPSRPACRIDSALSLASRS
mmetsp:Transcript_41101/g.110420  ORF Transcript_41101/g.110420 Transcript_41101/m.110420 type:complete len:234 (-) Transcript_41101:602-1303(-)